MTCEECKKRIEKEKNKSWRCKIGFHKEDNSLCHHEENYNKCVLCGDYIHGRYG